MLNQCSLSIQHHNHRSVNTNQPSIKATITTRASPSPPSVHYPPIRTAISHDAGQLHHHTAAPAQPEPQPDALWVRAQGCRCSHAANSSGSVQPAAAGSGPQFGATCSSSTTQQAAARGGSWHWQRHKRQRQGCRRRCVRACARRWCDTHACWLCLHAPPAALAGRCQLLPVWCSN